MRPLHRRSPFVHLEKTFRSLQAACRHDRTFPVPSPSIPPSSRRCGHVPPRRNAGDADGRRCNVGSGKRHERIMIDGVVVMEMRGGDVEAVRFRNECIRRMDGMAAGRLQSERIPVLLDRNLLRRQGECPAPWPSSISLEAIRQVAVKRLACCAPLQNGQVPSTI